MSNFIFRFAPSPNGFLHLGHAFSAVLNHEMAQALNGRFMLRIEDIDRARCSLAYEQAIYDDLAWLGLDWDTPVRRQSEHFGFYAALLQELERRGLAYPAFESRAEIMRFCASDARRDPDGGLIYPFSRSAMSDGERRRLRDEGRPYVLRLDMRRALEEVASSLSWLEKGVLVSAAPGLWGDVILGRRDIPASYHLCVVADDALQEISHVARGADLYPSTHLHCLLQAILGLPTPLYHHHRLILDGEGRKLSKSIRSTALRELRAAGMTVQGVRELFALELREEGFGAG